MLNVTVQKKALTDCFGLIFEESISYNKPFFSKVMLILPQSFLLCLKFDRLATAPDKTAAF